MSTPHPALAALPLFLGCQGSPAEKAVEAVSDAIDEIIEGGEEYDEYEELLWGDLDAGSGEGEVGYVLADPARGGLLCDRIHPIEAAEPLTDCADCTDAWALTLGEAEVEAEAAGGCADRALETLWVGVAGGVAYYDGGSGFAAAGESGEEEGLIWFDLSLED